MTQSPGRQGSLGLGISESERWLFARRRHRLPRRSLPPQQPVREGLACCLNELPGVMQTVLQLWSHVVIWCELCSRRTLVVVPSTITIIWPSRFPVTVLSILAIVIISIVIIATIATVVMITIDITPLRITLSVS